MNGNETKLYSYSKDTNKAVFRGDKPEYDIDFDIKVTQIAACLVKEGVKICIERFKKQNYHQDPELIQPTIKILNEAARFCIAIAPKSRVGIPPTESIKVSDKVSMVVTKAKRNQKQNKDQKEVSKR